MTSFWQKKFRNFEFKKSYIVLIVIIAVIIRFWGESSITMLEKDVPVVTATEISVDEITRYMQTKQDFLNENISIAQDIIVSRDLENYLDKETHEWFLLRGWRPKRFFYVEERLKQIIYHIRNRQKKLDEAERLEIQALQMMPAQADTDSVASDSAADFQKKAQDIRYYINREIRYAGITETEDHAVEDNLQLLEQLTGYQGE